MRSPDLFTALLHALIGRMLSHMRFDRVFGDNTRAGVVGDNLEHRAGRVRRNRSRSVAHYLHGECP